MLRSLESYFIKMYNRISMRYYINVFWVIARPSAGNLMNNPFWLLQHSLCMEMLMKLFFNTFKTIFVKPLGAILKIFEKYYFFQNFLKTVHQTFLCKMFQKNFYIQKLFHKLFIFLSFLFKLNFYKILVIIYKPVELFEIDIIVNTV